MNIDSFRFTNMGGRAYNEDAVGAQEFPSGGLYVVADGLGGHMLGEQASNFLVTFLTDAVPPQGQADSGDWLTQQIEVANTGLLALQEETRSNMKTTVAALLIQEQNAQWAYVGDSRIYYFHNGALTSVTEDHSVAYKKYKAGEITRAQICFDEDQSSLLRALGNENRHQPDVGAAVLEPGDGFLLCSDGLWEYLPDGEILIDFLKSDCAEEWAEQLLLRVISRQCPNSDNLSLITVMVH